MPSANPEKSMLAHQISIFNGRMIEQGKPSFDMQHVKFRHCDLKHGSFCRAMRSRDPSNLSHMIAFIAPISTSPRAPISSSAKSSLSTAPSRFCGDDNTLLHRPHCLFRGEQSSQ
jgi:hypothetical protein